MPIMTWINARPKRIPNDMMASIWWPSKPTKRAPIVSEYEEQKVYLFYLYVKYRKSLSILPASINTRLALVYVLGNIFVFSI